MSDRCSLDHAAMARAATAKGITTWCPDCDAVFNLPNGEGSPEPAQPHPLASSQPPAGPISESTIRAIRRLPELISNLRGLRRAAEDYLIATGAPTITEGLNLRDASFLALRTLDYIDKGETGDPGRKGT